MTDIPMGEMGIPGANSGSGGSEHAASAALDARLRVELGRRLTLVMLWTPEAASAYTARGKTDETLATFRAEVGVYQEVRLLAIDSTEVPESSLTQAVEARIEAALRETLRMDADAVLIWQGAQTAPLGTHDDADEREWLLKALVVAERLNLFDAATLALFGPSVTRAQARALGYEDGFALTEPLAEAVHAALERLTRDALARAEYRHKGSSPPCYL